MPPPKAPSKPPLVPAAASSPITEIDPGRRLGCMLGLVLIAFVLVIVVRSSGSLFDTAWVSLRRMVGEMSTPLGTFAGRAGSTVNVRLNEPFPLEDIRMWLQSPSGTLMIPPESSPTGSYDCVLLTEDGAYTVFWDAAAPEDSAAPFEVLSVVAPVQTLAVGQRTQGTLKECHAVFALEGREWQTISVRARSTAFDGVLRLWERSNREIAFNDDADGINPALESVMLLNSETYWITLSSYTAGGSGSYELEVSEG